MVARFPVLRKGGAEIGKQGKALHIAPFPCFNPRFGGSPCPLTYKIPACIKSHFLV